MKYIRTIVMIIMVFVPVLLWAQGPGGDDDLDDPGVPIDGGASILAGAAVMYGVRKLKKNKDKDLK